MLDRLSPGAGPPRFIRLAEGLHILHTLGGPQQTSIISERGHYDEARPLCVGRAMRDTVRDLISVILAGIVADQGFAQELAELAHQLDQDGSHIAAKGVQNVQTLLSR